MASLPVMDLKPPRLVIALRNANSLLYFTHCHIFKLQTLSCYTSSTTEVQALARRVFIG